MENVIEVLEERGFIELLTSEGLRDILNQPCKVYCGFDPTSDSLHLGNMIALMGLAWFQRLGHTPVALMGGATGMIGDPSGKAAERVLLNESTIQQNLQGIRKNLDTFLQFSPEGKLPVILNNYDWFKDFSFISFLREVGKYFRIGPMLSKESVKARMESEEGMSFTEFSYQLLQSYDFYYLFKNHGVTVQIGGSDQWGNITAGTEFVRKMLGVSVHGITFPLLTRSDGQKFGKSESGAISLSPEKLSPYEFYQYLIRVSDADVIKMMRLLTFMDMSEIRKIEREMSEPDYQANSAQKRLAEEVTKIVHGSKGLEIALKVTEGAAPGSETKLDVATLMAISQNMPNRLLLKSEVLGIRILDLLVKTSLQSSKGEARKLIKNGGVYLNNIQILDENLVMGQEHFIGDCMFLLSVGKKNKVLIRLEGLEGGGGDGK